MDYYQILGVNQQSTQEEIKKAFRKLSFQHHPDKGGDENKFKQINEAYSVLSDEQKKIQYDTRGNNPFSQFGQGFNPFEDIFGNMMYQRKRAVPDKMIELSLSIMESYKGVEKNITYTRKKECITCKGSGGERKTCTNCNGEGFKVLRTGTGLFIQMVRQVCSSCNGVGQIISNKCHTCLAEGSVVEMDNVSIKIPRGIDEGNFLRLEGRGDYIQGMYGNLVIKIKIINDNVFEKINNDLIYNVYFDYESLKNDTIEISHPDGLMSVKLPDEFDSTKTLRIKSKGFITSEGVGDLYVKLNVRFNRSYFAK